MKQRILIGVALVVLSCAGAWMLVSRTAGPNGSDIQRPGAVAPAEQDAVDLTATDAETDARRAAATAVSPASSPEPATLPANTALLKVLTVDKLTRKPLVGMHVYSAHDTGERSNKLEQTTRSRGKPFEVLVTDKDGRVEIEIPASIESSVNGSGGLDDVGWATLRIPPLQAGVTFDAVLELPAGDDMSFWMKVVDDETQAPLQGVRISKSVRPDPSKPRTVIDEPVTTSDSLGLAVFAGRSWQQSNLSFQLEGRSTRYVATESGHERADTAFLVALPRASTLRIHAVDGAGAPVVGVGVELTTSAYHLYPSGQFTVNNLERDPRWRGSTDETGRATFVGLPPRVSLAASVHGKVEWSLAKPIVLEPAEVRDVEWKITNGCDVFGRISDQHDRPVAGHLVWLRKAERPVAVIFDSYDRGETSKCTTTADGRFRFPGVSPGSWWVGPSAKDRYAAKDLEEVAPFGQIVEIADGQNSIEVNLRVDRGLFIRGQVLSSAGKPIDSGYVRAYEPVLKLHTDASTTDGTFALGPLMDGNYNVYASGSSGDADAETVVARAGTEGLVIQLRAGAALSGRVIGPDGKGLAGMVHIANHDPRATGPYQLSVNNDGVFTMNGLQPGTFDVSATTTSGWVGVIDPVEIAAGAAVKDLIIRVTQGGFLRVKHAGPEKMASVTVMQNGITIKVDYVAIGKVAELAAPLGSVVVRVRYLAEGSRDGARTVDRVVDVRLGERTDVDFEAGAH